MKIISNKFCIFCIFLAEYKPPKAEDLKDELNYPNLNSTDYRARSFKVRDGFLPFFEIIEQNEDGKLLLGTNSYYDRIFNSCVFAFDNFEDISDVSKSTFRVPSESLLTNIKFVGANHFLLTKENGFIELWSTKSEKVGQENGSDCLFKVGSSIGGSGSANALDIFKDQNKAITCSTDCSIQVSIFT